MWIVFTRFLIEKGYIGYHDRRAYTLRDPVNNTIFFEATPEAGLIVLNCKVESQGNKGRVHLSYPVSIPSSASQTSPQETWRSSPIKEATPSTPSMQGTAATAHQLTPDLLHQRFGHLHADLLSSIAESQGMDIKVTRDNIQYCSACVKSKRARKKIGKRAVPPAITIGDLIDSDVCGPIELSCDGYRYYVSFLDNHS